VSEHLSFSADLPWPILIAVAIATLGPCLFGVALRARGAIPRLAACLLTLAILTGPQRIISTARLLPDIALILLDHSQSMEIGARDAMAARALAALRASAGATQLDIVTIPPADTGGTALAPALAQALSTIQPSQLAGIIAITDGEVSGATTLPRRVPFTALLTAKTEETDRELRLLNAPSYGLAGQNLTLHFIVTDHGVADTGAAATVTFSEDGTQILTTTAAIGQPSQVSLPIHHAGPNIITASVTPLSGEVSLINNQAAFTLNGIHKRLNVLLISGSPDQGERAWRLLLKSDPAIQLVHFTILRTPGEAVDADPQDIALIPFPVRELFETDIGKFDLIILDGFNADGLLPPAYLGNIANYVQHGGALLAEVGPEFSGVDSLAYSPLGAILPAAPIPSGTVTQPFAPAVTPLGARHPVTAPFANQPLATWYRMEAASPSSGNILLAGPGNLPLLILADTGQGRSGILLSDQLWLWTRGSPHQGPALALLRRTVHWLLREPALEAESLTASIANNHLTIRRQTLSATYPGDATLTAPDGATQPIALTPTSPGQFTASLPVSPIGVWKITEGALTAYATGTDSNLEEYQDLAATAANLRDAATNLIWLGRDPAPSLGPLLSHRHATQITGARSIALLPPLPSLAAVLALIVLAWWRENGHARKASKRSLF
jgi:hypothetical protein